MLAKEANSAHLTQLLGLRLQLESDVKALQLKQVDDKKALEMREQERKEAQYQLDEVRAALDKARAEAETLARSKKSLEAQLERLTEELGEDGKNVSESRKANKKLEATIERVRSVAQPGRGNALSKNFNPCFCCPTKLFFFPDPAIAPSQRSGA